MKRLTTILCLTLFLTESRSLVGREPSTHQTGGETAESRSLSQKLVWNANPSNEGISGYNGYEKNDNGREPPSWKRIPTAHKPSRTVRNAPPRPPIFAATAAS